MVDCGQRFAILYWTVYYQCKIPVSGKSEPIILKKLDLFSWKFHEIHTQRSLVMRAQKLLYVFARRYQKISACMTVSVRELRTAVREWACWRRYFFCGSFMFLFCLVFAMFCARLFICALWSPAGKGLTSWLSFVVSSVSLSLSHWYPGSGVVLDCIDSWSLHHYLLLTSTLDSGVQTDMLVLVFSKAFDRVPNIQFTREATPRWHQGIPNSRSHTSFLAEPSVAVDLRVVLQKVCLS